MRSAQVLPVRTEGDLLTLLSERGIPFQRIQHPAVFTCEQADLYRPKQPAVSTKNLFLRDKHGRLFLVMTDCDKKLDLKALSQAIHAPKLHFASEELLMQMLGLGAGSVTVLGLINDAGQRVQLWIDQEIWQHEFFLCHPMVNTATLTLAKGALERFFALTGHEIHLIKM